MNTLMSAVREPVQLADLLNLLGRSDETTERLGRVETQIRQAAARLNKMRSDPPGFNNYETPEGHSSAEGRDVEMQSFHPPLGRPSHPPPPPPKNAGTGKLSGNRPAGSHHPLGSVPAENTVSTLASVHAPPRGQVPLSEQPLGPSDVRYATGHKEEVRRKHMLFFGTPYDV